MTGSLLLSDVLGINLSLGALSESEQLATTAVTEPVRGALLHAVAAYRQHAFQSLWVVATKAVSVFSIFGSATKDVLKE